MAKYFILPAADFEPAAVGLREWGDQRKAAAWKAFLAIHLSPSIGVWNV
jgi:hypothetical protein